MVDLVNKVTKADYARLRGVSRAYITELLRKDVITETDDGKIDVADADRRIELNRDPTKATRASVEHSTQATSDRLAFLAARARRERANADTAELEYKAAIGVVVAAEDVRAAAFQSARDARNRLLAIPDRLAPILAAETSPFEVHKLLIGEIRQALNELADAAEVPTTNTEKMK